MADSRLHAVSGFRDGMRDTLSIFDAVDARKQRKADAERTALLFDQAQEDRARGLARAEVLTEREDTAYADSRTDRARAMERDDFAFDQAKAQGARAEELHPLQVQLARAQASGAYSREQLTKMQMRLTEQEGRAKQAGGIAAQAAHLARAGDMEAAGQLYDSLGEYGFDVPAFTTEGATEMRAATDDLVNGRIRLNDPRAVRLAKQLLTPSLVASGRDPARYEIAGLVPSPGERGTFTVAMLDRETGQSVPATLGASADDDTVTEIRIEDLMAASQNLISMADTAATARAEAAAARFGVAPPEREAPMTDLERRAAEADIGLTEARTAKALAGDGKGGPGAGLPRDRASFVQAFGGEMAAPGDAQVARLLAEQPDFDPDTALETIRATRALISEGKAQTGIEALAFVEAERTITREIGNYAQKLVDSEGVDPEEAGKLAERFQRGQISEQQLTRRLEALRTRRERTEQREAAKRRADEERRARSTVVVEPRP